MALPCLGPIDVIPSTKEIGLEAQQYVFRRFEEYFTSLRPDGFVIQEVDYLGLATTVFAKDAARQGALGLGSKNPVVNAFLQLLRDRYKGGGGIVPKAPGPLSARWPDLQRFTFRKNDALGICASQSLLELLEVTTVTNVLDANSQILEKQRLLTSLAKELSYQLAAQFPNFPTPMLWVEGSRWTLPPETTYVIQKLRTEDSITYVCFEPTYRVPIRKQGVILYEVHRVKAERVPQTLPSEIRQKLIDEIRKFPPNLTPEEAKKRGRQYAKDNPDLGRWVLDLDVGIKVAFAILLGIVLVVLAVIAFLDAIPAIMAFLAGIVLEIFVVQTAN